MSLLWLVCSLCVSVFDSYVEIGAAINTAVLSQNEEELLNYLQQCNGLDEWKKKTQCGSLRVSSTTRLATGRVLIDAPGVSSYNDK